MWEKELGGSENDEAVSVQQTLDNGYIIGGYSRSSDGNVGENKGLGDAWILKLNASGELLWEKTVGGSGSEVVNEIKEVTEGGFIAVCATTSSDGDISSNNGGTDFWVLRLDICANIVWQKSLGGTGNDYGFSIEEATDDGYIAAGSWYTNIVDTGEGSSGDFDYWVVKLE